MAEQTSGEKVAIVGSGLIGGSWAVLFLSAGFQVRIYDISNSQLDGAVHRIRKQLLDLKDKGLQRSEAPIEELMSALQTTTSLTTCLEDVVYVQECVPENLDLKLEVWRRIDEIIGGRAASADSAAVAVVLASSSSTLPAGRLSDRLTGRNRFLVAHPINPPFYCPLVELVAAPWTDPTAVDRAYDLMTRLGQTPIRVKKDVVGYVMNRLQYSVLAECWRLVQEGVADVEDLNKAVTDGLGPRYAFLGPLEVAHLNANGIEDYAHRYNEGYLAVCETLGPAPSWETPELLQNIKAQLESKVPLDKLEDKRRWRDDRLAALARLKRSFDK